MATNEQRAFYVRHSGGYDGPINASEVRQWAEAQGVDSDAQVWSPETNQWVTLQNFQSEHWLEDRLANSTNQAPQQNPHPTGSQVPETTVATLRTEAAPSLRQDLAFVFAEKLGREAWSEAEAEASRTRSHSDETRESLEGPKAKHKWIEQHRYAVLAGLAGLALSIIASMYMGPPQSLLKEVSGLSRDDLRNLNAAAQESVATGPAAALASVRDETGRVSFIAGTNLPAGSQVELEIEGVTGTLVGALRVRTRAQERVDSHLIRTAPFVQPDDRPFPVGEYRVTLKCRACPGDFKGVIAQRSFFVGEKTTDYDRQLSAYHAKVRQQSASELEEIKQLVGTLEGQLGETESFAHRQQSGTPLWAAFTQEWSAMQNQIAALSRERQRDAEKLVHAGLFLLLHQAIDLVTKLHRDQAAWGDKKNSEVPTSWLSQIAIARSTTLALRAKVAVLERQPPLANGLPYTESPQIDKR